MGIVEELSSVDPQAHLDDLDNFVESINLLATKANATKLLRPALVAQSPSFSGFNRACLTRFEAFLQCVFVTTGSIPVHRASSLQSLSVIPLIVCGVSLNKKALIRTEKKVFDAVIQLAQDATPKLGPALITDKNLRRILGKGPSLQHKDGMSATPSFERRC